mmetsp:Transcript_37159/g.51573  ORF Transcript_37159/g.51573 Transcript_37159/m.51573 type:complete len:269 (+) Transcript_37159:255-1061(+)|eukprot:CAMPEP_0196579492 /NCGR_PEP_ID=MMETSP1081-20130531/22035_1 /TAXON_ID=36882 /ORGANISM="Pyramimonas amylifera, Strain CCMP720" /LENGTH=268 /DNA_ID=CAMNT_0041899105 /DNA_START=248 /DNA_END=1054 /DNA_ORIENTATION=-
MQGYNADQRGASSREHRGFRGTADNAKTVLCTRYTSSEGCRFGERCNFAHGDTELMPRKPRFTGAPGSGSPNSASGGGRGQGAGRGDPWAGQGGPRENAWGQGRGYGGGGSGYNGSGNQTRQYQQRPGEGAWGRGGGPGTNHVNPDGGVWGARGPSMGYGNVPGDVNGEYKLWGGMGGGGYGFMSGQQHPSGSGAGEEYSWGSQTGGNQQPNAWNRRDGGDSRSFSGASGQGHPQHGGWSQHSAPDGTLYYYNSLNGVSQWERPAELA